MALTVDSTPLSPTCNSYVSLAETSDYIANTADESLFDAWDSLEAARRSAYVVDATRRLDGLYEWIGSKYSSQQRLRWPRVNAVVEEFLLDSTTVPLPVKHATCEMAIWLMNNDGVVAVQQSQAYSAIKVGPINIDFNDRLQTAPQAYAPDIIAILLKEYGQMIAPSLPGTNQIKMAKLYRA